LTVHIGLLRRIACCLSVNKKRLCLLVVKHERPHNRRGAQC
jgi:hypothetical protein